MPSTAPKLRVWLPWTRPLNGPRPPTMPGTRPAGTARSARLPTWKCSVAAVKARVALDSAVRALPSVYRRDRGVALSALAAACAALGEPGEAATTAMRALALARDAGSERIVSMVIPVAAALARHCDIEAVAQLHEALAEPSGD
jgi:hypothetical protein